MAFLQRCSSRVGAALPAGTALLACAILLLTPALAQACPGCAVGREARSQVWHEQFASHLAIALLPFLAVAAVSARVEKTGPAVQVSSARRGPLISAGLLLGTGLGGFVDGILLHQILQWHNMLSSVRPPTDLVSMKYNMLWDGLFHAFTWLMCAAGLWRLWVAARQTEVAWSPRVFLGALWLGWGLFNFVEGLIDHQLLGIHHVHPGAGQLAWDLGFLAFGVSQIVTGWVAIRSAPTELRR